MKSDDRQFAALPFFVQSSSYHPSDHFPSPWCTVRMTWRFRCFTANRLTNRLIDCPLKSEWYVFPYKSPQMRNHSRAQIFKCRRPSKKQTFRNEISNWNSNFEPGSYVVLMNKCMNQSTWNYVTIAPHMCDATTSFQTRLCSTDIKCVHGIAAYMVARNFTQWRGKKNWIGWTLVFFTTLLLYTATKNKFNLVDKNHCYCFLCVVINVVAEFGVAGPPGLAYLRMIFLFK